MRCKRVFSTPTGDGAYVPAASWMNKPTADWPVYNVRRAQHSRFAWTQQSLWVVTMAGLQYAWRTIFNFVHLLILFICTLRIEHYRGEWVNNPMKFTVDNRGMQNVSGASNIKVYMKCPI